MEDNELDSSQIARMLEGDIIKVEIAASGKDALEMAAQRDFDCIILDYTLPDITGADMVNKIGLIKKRLTPVIIYSARDFNKNELKNINRTSNTIVLKGVKKTIKRSLTTRQKNDCGTGVPASKGCVFGRNQLAQRSRSVCFSHLRTRVGACFGCFAR